MNPLLVTIAGGVIAIAGWLVGWHQGFADGYREGRADGTSATGLDSDT
jgi:hypothetical protein